MPQSDEELMSCFRDGDNGAFELLYQRYQKPLFSFIYRVVMNAIDTEDICQETFFRILRGKKRYQTTGKFKTWIFRIAINLCRDRLRKKKVRTFLSINNPEISQDCEEIQIQKSITDSLSNPIKQIETEEMKMVLQEAFLTLPEEQRIVVILKEYHYMKFSEIAEILSSPIGTVKSLNYRGHENLRKILKKYLD
jgi:RNA polymerase sigma-70 factor (ECF subfamily)